MQTKHPLYRFKRMTNAQRLAITPAIGQAIYCTDTGVAWVGDGLTVGGNPSAFLASQYLLRDWNASIAKQQVGGVLPTIVALVGDSWTSGQNYSAALTTYLQNRYGNAGAGYVSAEANLGPGPLPGITRARLGTWSDIAPSTATAANLLWAKSTDISTPASWQIAATVTDFVFYYMQQSGGGSFRWQVDGGSWTTVSTDGASTALQSLSVTGLSSASHIFKIEVTVAGTAGVVINGLDCQINGTGGVRVHNLGASGTKASDWAGVSQTPWRAAFAALTPNAVVVMLGVNDATAAVLPSTYAASLGTIATNITASVSTADIVFVSPGDIGTVTTYAMSAYDNAMKNQSVTSSVGYMSGYQLLGSYASANARGLYANTTHFNATGGEIVAAYLGDYLAKNDRPWLGNFFGNVYLRNIASGRIPYTSTNGLLVSSSNFNWDSSNGTMTVQNGTSVSSNFAFRTSGNYYLDVGAAGGTTAKLTIRNNAQGTTVAEFGNSAITLYKPTLIKGTATNDSAVAGYIGEIISSLVASGSPVSLSNNTAANVTSISLTAGDWDVEGNVNYTLTSATLTASKAGINSTSATVPTDGSEVFSGLQLTTTSAVNAITLPRKRITIASTTTIYLVGHATFSAGTAVAFGSISARRVR